MESPRQPGDAKPQTQGARSAAAAPPVAERGRRFPKPPALWKRFILLCIHPESWAMAARYPTRFTLLALGLAIVMAGASAGVGDGMRLTDSVKAFGQSYAKQQFPPLELSSEGVLKAEGELKEPINFSFPPFRVVVDPTNKTAPESLKMPHTVLITDHTWTACGEGFLGGVPYPLSTLAVFGVPLPEPGKHLTITGETIQEFAPQLGATMGVYLSVLFILGNILWAGLMMFLICPLIMVVASSGERRLLLPRRAAYRMAAAFLVPVVLFGGLMHAAGYSIANALGDEPGTLFWFFSAAAMAVWTGIMAKNMYGPPTRRRPSGPT